MEEILEYCEEMMEGAMGKMIESDNQVTVSINAGAMFAYETVIQRIREVMRYEDSDRD